MAEKEPIIIDTLEKYIEHFGTAEGLEAATTKATKVMQRKLEELQEFLDLVGTKQRCCLCGKSFAGKPKKKGVPVCGKCMVRVNGILKEEDAEHVGSSAIRERRVLGRCSDCNEPCWEGDDKTNAVTINAEDGRGARMVCSICFDHSYRYRHQAGRARAWFS